MTLPLCWTTSLAALYTLTMTWRNGRWRCRRRCSRAAPPRPRSTFATTFSTHASTFARLRCCTCLPTTLTGRTFVRTCCTTCSPRTSSGTPCTRTLWSVRTLPASRTCAPTTRSPATSSTGGPTRWYPTPTGGVPSGRRASAWGATTCTRRGGCPSRGRRRCVKTPSWATTRPSARAPCSTSASSDATAALAPTAGWSARTCGTTWSSRTA
mmetsp:Transcript_13891/g.43730  ORF Transcript_13891/g.43730 Transcript_13891/m.43730 type:complete len:211 (+) Transcript_13891:62-694(+)